MCCDIFLRSNIGGRTSSFLMDKLFRCQFRLSLYSVGDMFVLFLNNL